MRTRILLIALISLLVIFIVLFLVKRKYIYFDFTKKVPILRFYMRKVWDSVSESYIMKLNPNNDIKQRAIAFLNEAEDEGIKLRIYSSFRSFDEQQKEYDKGRTTPGKIVTYAKPGYSYHNYGLAFDLVEIKDGKALWSNPNWNKIGELGKKHGFYWGGDFKKIKDNPHFEIAYGYSTSDLLAMKNAGGFDTYPNIG